MSEQLPTTEKKRSAYGELVKGLSEGEGIENPEVREALIGWSIEREGVVKLKGETHEAKIDLEIERAELYMDGNYPDEAFETLEQALYVARQENRPNLERKVLEKIERFEAIEAKRQEEMEVKNGAE